jgi:hypothetical protein
MVKKKLVEGLIRDGARLLHELDRQDFPVESMFWTHLPDEDYWRLVIASPVVKQQGGAAAYQRLNELLRSIGLVGITLEDISLLDPESAQFRSLYSLARGSSRLAAGPEWLEFEDAVVYRWTGESVTGELSCDISTGELKKLWEAEREPLPSSSPALLISSEQRRITLRIHPQHKPGGIEEIKKAFRFALHRSHPDCQVTWLD